MNKLAVVCAFEHEAVPYIGSLIGETQTNFYDGRTCHKTGEPLQFAFHEGKLFGREAVVGIIGVGHNNAVLGTQILLGNHDVELVILSGVCGGLSNNLGIGDVVVAEQIMCVNENQIYQTSNKFSEMAKAVTTVGNFAAVNHFVKDEERENLGLSTGTIVVDCESGAVAKVCTDIGVDFAVAKGLTDGIGCTGKGNWWSHVPTASKNAFDVVSKSLTLDKLLGVEV